MVLRSSTCVGLALAFALIVARLLGATRTTTRVAIGRSIAGNEEEPLTVGADSDPVAAVRTESRELLELGVAIQWPESISVRLGNVGPAFVGECRRPHVLSLRVAAIAVSSRTFE